MKNEQINEITSKVIEQLVAALNAGHSERLTAYLRHRAGILRGYRSGNGRVSLPSKENQRPSYRAVLRFDAP